MSTQTGQVARRVVHFVLHVPKCAGTTIEWHFRKHLDTRFRYAPRWRSLLRDVIGNRYPGLVSDDLAGVDVVSGHSLSSAMRHLFPGAEVREYVLLRDPVSWHLSMYNYRLQRRSDSDGPAFADWYGTVRRNPVSRFLLNRYFDNGVPSLYRLSSSARLVYLENRLARFTFVGGIKHTDVMIDGISRSLGVPGAATAENTIPAKRVTSDDLPPGMLDRIREDNQLDQVLYDRWADRGWADTPAPSAPRPDLARSDHLRYIAGDIRSALRRNMA